MKNAVRVDENVQNLLSTLTYTTKKRGGKNGDENTCTLCANPKTPRLTVPVRFYENGFRAGLVGENNGTYTVVLTKNRYNNAFSALHSTQHFITVVGGTAEKLRALSYTFSVVDEKTVDKNTVSFVLKPNGDTYTKKH